MSPEERCELLALSAETVDVEAMVQRLHRGIARDPELIAQHRRRHARILRMPVSAPPVEVEADFLLLASEKS